MSVLHDDLCSLARAIVRFDPPSQGMAGGENYSVATALEVYRNNYRGNLHDALTGAYPVIEQLVGRDFFKALTRHYIGQHPSHSGNLHHFGAHMASFVAAFEPARELVYLPDVAALEWACHCAWFADDAALFDVVKLRAIPPKRYPELILHTHPACHLVRSRYPVAAIWHAHQEGAPDDFHIELGGAPCNTLVSRKHNVVVVSELSDADVEWLQALQAGAPMGEATLSTQKLHPDFDLLAALQNLLAQHALSDFGLGETP